MSENQVKALIVDDEPDIRELLEMTLIRMGLGVDTAEDLANARRLLGSNQYALCLTDMRLPDGNGLSLIKEINRDYPQIPVAMITAYGKVEDAVTALKYGAFDFVTKPIDLQVLRNLVKTAVKLRKQEAQQARSREEASEDSGKEPPGEADGPPMSAEKQLERMIGKSEAIRKVRKTVAKLARSQAPVMISGDSGTGKELAAQLIHDLGPRHDRPFVPVNCGAIPSELMESEFFGHIKGSFTGAETDKEGLFQAANGGTLFLDEVADLPLNMQVKLLRVIQEKSVRPIGGREELQVDVRILSASHKPLKPLVESGDFRSDLFYRLNVIELTMPPLHERPEDIPMLTEHFLASIGKQWEEPPKKPNPETMELLKGHTFSGNVRELVNILQRAVTLCDGEIIEPDDLQLDAPAMPEEESLPDRDEDQSLDDYIDNVERQILEKALRDSKYNKTQAAHRLGITFRSLRYKLKKFGID